MKNWRKILALLVRVDYYNHGDVKSKSYHKGNAPKEFEETLIIKVFIVKQIKKQEDEG